MADGNSRIVQRTVSSEQITDNREQRTEIVLTTINAKWIHPSLALRLLKANLGELEDRCEIIEFALRQPLTEKLEVLSSVHPKILGISVSIWNHTAIIELLKELKNQWKYSAKTLLTAPCSLLPVIVMGGPEVSYLPEDAEIFQYADFVIRGEGEIAFRKLCEKILAGENPQEKFINAEEVDISKIKSAYHLYTDEDVKRKLIYVESSRGCPFGCEFCLSSASTAPLRLCAMDEFLEQIEVLIERGANTLKFLDRTFNSNINRAIQICDFFIKKCTFLMGSCYPTVHFELVPTLITPELIEVLVRFPPGTLRLEIGIQTLNPEVAERINLPGRRGKTPDQILEPLRLLRKKTNAIIHADLIAGLPGETMESFARGFDALYEALACGKGDRHLVHQEIQLGILKQLPGAPISRHNKEFKMRYNPDPPYEVMETSTMSVEDIARIKNFARFWERCQTHVGHKPTHDDRHMSDTNPYIDPHTNPDIVSNICQTHVRRMSDIFSFNTFMSLSDALFAHFGRNWGIDKDELMAQIDIYTKLR